MGHVMTATKTPKTAEIKVCTHVNKMKRDAKMELALLVQNILLLLLIKSHAYTQYVIKKR